ncbi:MAG: hypothetical protein HYX26_09060 [Acidobacteriales bacterium]|nr:hypothetical protein [Terriglobales bacterium]
MRTLSIAVLLFCAFSAHAWQASQPADSPDVKADTAKPQDSRPVASSNGPQLPADLQDVVKKQFGSSFAIALHRSGDHVRYAKPSAENWTPFLTADLDGDGIEDAIIVVRGKGVLSHAAQYDYKVSDPYYTYNGFGDVKITSTLDTEDPNFGHIVLIIHGAGPEAWRATTPKAKFAIINLPFDNLSITMVGNKNKAKNRLALNLESNASEMAAVILWDGKKYKYRDVGGK